jgi:hypothetical protein
MPPRSSQVIADFDEVPPLSQIRDAMARHIEAIQAGYLRYRLPFPESPWPEKVERYASLQAACERAWPSRLPVTRCTTVCSARCSCRTSQRRAQGARGGDQRYLERSG